jgi:hypothetical protein
VSDLDGQINRVMENARKKADLFVRAFASEADKRLREKTPVDTGYARGNWNMAVGAPDDTVADRFEPGATSPRPSPGGAGDVIYLTNAVPYIDALEHGHSKQAPAGMVRLTQAELQPLAEQIAVQVNRL